VKGPALPATVGVLEVRLVIRQAQSLKDKRRVVRSLKDRLRSRFDVAVAETDLQDDRQQAVLAVAVVGGDESVLGGVLNKIVDFVRNNPDAVLCDYSIEMR
jgi:hypothetical protein